MKRIVSFVFMCFVLHNVPIVFSTDELMVAYREQEEEEERQQQEKNNRVIVSVVSDTIQLRYDWIASLEDDLYSLLQGANAAGTYEISINPLFANNCHVMITKNGVCVDQQAPKNKYSAVVAKIKNMIVFHITTLNQQRSEFEEKQTAVTADTVLQEHNNWRLLMKKFHKEKKLIEKTMQMRKTNLVEAHLPGQQIIRQDTFVEDQRENKRRRIED